MGVPRGAVLATMARFRSLWPSSAIRGWLLLALAFGSFLALASVDRALKRLPHGGFLPGGDCLTLTTVQWPGFWSRLEATDTGRAAAEPLAKLNHAAALPVLRRTGIRPTPARWRLWLGPALNISWRDEGEWGVCVRPGILARMAHLANRTITGQIAPKTIYRLLHRSGSLELHYAWRNGFLLVSPSREFLQDALVAEPMPLPLESNDAITLARRHGPPLELTITPENGLPLRAVLGLSADATTASPHLVPASLPLLNGWPDAPMVSGSAASWPHARALATTLMASLPPMVDAPLRQALPPLLREAWGFDALKPGWSDTLGAWAFALWPGQAWPEAAWAMERKDPASTEHPLLATVPPEERISVAWTPETPGTMAPRLGSGWTLCLDEDSDARLWLATTTEASMARIRRGLNATSEPVADYALRVRWPQTGTALARGIRWLVHSELIPGWGGADLDGAMEAFEKVTEHMGTARVTGTVAGDEVLFEGFLAGQDPTPP